MDCLDCGGEMARLWTVDVGHAGETVGWSPKSVCPECTPDYHRRFA